MNTRSYFYNDLRCHGALGSWGHWTLGLVACSLVLLVGSPAIPLDEAGRAGHWSLRWLRESLPVLSFSC